VRGGRALGAALASGGLLAAAFPPFGMGALAWVALVPLWLAVRAAPAPRAFALGWACGATAFGLVLAWTVTALLRSTTLTPWEARGCLALMAGTLGLSTGLFAAGTSWTVARGFPTLIVAPVWWVAAEWLRGLGSPWLPLGVSQHAALGVAQLAAIAGVAGISGLLILVNVAVAEAVAARRHRPLVILAAAAALGCAAAALGWGIGPRHAERAASPHETEASLRVALVHASVDPRRERDVEYADDSLRSYAALSRRAVAGGVDVVVWPETALRADVEGDTEARAALRRVVRELRVPVILGGAAVQSDTAGGARRFNRAYLLDTAGSIAATYDKQVLVPFGEYIPLARLLPGVRPVVTSVGLTAGRAPQVLDVGPTRAGVLICYEAAIPWVARGLVAAGATVLLNLSNDTWYAGTAGVEQSLVQAVFRAIEVGRPLLRVASDGTSAVIAPDGGIVWRGETRRGSWHVAVVGLRRGQTPYSRLGDALPWACLTLCAGMLVAPPHRPARDVGSRKRG
jgi:apolipoprotein N-acyltransferase